MPKHLAPALFGLPVVLALAAPALVLGQTTSTLSRDQYRAAKARIEAESDAAEARCAALRGSAKDICEEEADGREKIAEAELEQQYKPSPRNARKLAQARIEAEYELALERCDALEGAAEKNCEKEAEARRTQSRTQLRR